jgi:hypothetical protein
MKQKLGTSFFFSRQVSFWGICIFQIGSFDRNSHAFEMLVDAPSFIRRIFSKGKKKFKMKFLRFYSLYCFELYFTIHAVNGQVSRQLIDNL